MTAHDFADHFDVRRTIASKDVGDIPEVARAQQTRTDDCLARLQVGTPSTDGKRGDAVTLSEDGFIEVVVAVRRGHAFISGYIAFKDAHTASGLVCVDVKTDGESPDLDWLGSCVRHEW